MLANVTGANGSGEENMVPVMEAWEKNVNEDGGVAGHEVKIELEDTKGEASTAQAVGTRVAGDDGVVAAISFDANAESVYAKRISESGLAVVGGVGFSPSVWGALPNWLPIATTFPSVINAGFVMAESDGAKTTAEVVCAEVPTCKEQGGLAKNATELLDMTYGGTFAVAAATPSYTAECLKVLDEKIDYVVLGHSAQVGLRMIKDCEKQGYSGGWAMSSNMGKKVFDEGAPESRISLALNAFPWWVDDAPVVAYRDLVQGAGIPEDMWSDIHSTAAYATLELFKKALEADDGLPADVDREAVIDAYGQVKDETLDGLLPQPITFTENEPEPLVSCYWLAAYDDKTFGDAEFTEPVCDPAEITEKG